MLDQIYRLQKSLIYEYNFPHFLYPQKLTATYWLCYFDTGPVTASSQSGSAVLEWWMELVKIEPPSSYVRWYVKKKKKVIELSQFVKDVAEFVEKEEYN